MVRLAEVIAALSLATDLGLGQPMEHHLRACLLAVAIAEELKLSAGDRRDVYYMALLRWVGCTAHAHEASELYGDEIAMRARIALADPADPRELVPLALRHLGEGRPLPRRFRILVTTLAGGRSAPSAGFRASCQVAQMFAERLCVGPGVGLALGHAFERWDGRGYPAGISGDRVALPARIALLAQDVEIFHRSGGAAAIDSLLSQRTGHAYDPSVAEAFSRVRPRLPELLEGPAWDRVMAAEPVPARHLGGQELDEALRVLADYADLKTPFTTGHSRAVSVLALGAASLAGLPAADAKALGQAGWVHDLGRTGIPNSIWERSGPLADGEWERVRLHPYYTERVLERVLPSLAALASANHERLDGTGYHRRLPGSQLSLAQRLLATADAYQAMTEPRPYRAALSPKEAAAELHKEARSGRLDAESVNLVLSAAGHRPQKRRSLPAGLTVREVEVLRLIARGSTTRQVARELGISERTASHHVQHIYDKAGISTRGAAALFAMQKALM